MRFKKFTFNPLSIMIGFHYGRNPVNGARFLHVAPIPFFGLDFHWPHDDATWRVEESRLPFESPGVAALAPKPRRRLGQCPLGTPGCKYADCSAAPGHSCYGPDAPLHIDMSAGPGDLLEGR